MNTNPKVNLPVFLLMLGSVFVVSAFLVSLFNPYFSKATPMLAEGVVTKVEGFYTYYTFELEGVRYENRALGREPHCAGKGDIIPVKYLSTPPPQKYSKLLFLYLLQGACAVLYRLSPLYYSSYG